MSYPYIFESAPLLVVLVAILFVGFGVGLYFACKKVTYAKLSTAYIFLAVLLVFRVILAGILPWHADMTSFFLPWSDQLSSPDFFSFYLTDAGEVNLSNDYPPLFMYFLALAGLVAKAFSLSEAGWIFLMKLPAVFCDVVSGLFILKISVLLYNNKKLGSKNKEYFREKLEDTTGKVPLIGVCCMLLYLVNPAIVTDSAWWGQVDGITAMFLVITLYLVMARKDTLAVVCAVVALCFKLQYIFVAPALGMFYLIKLSKEKGELFKKLAKGVGISAVVFLAINLPLAYVPMKNGYPTFMFDVYFNQVANYSYYTLNASNVFGALDLNFIPLDGSFSSGAWTVFVVLVCCVVVICGMFGKNNVTRIAPLGAFTIITVFMFSVKMHERYMIYALILLLICFLQTGKLVDLLIYLGFSVIQFATIGSIMLIDGLTFNFYDERLQILSIICLTMYFGYVILKTQAILSRGNHKR